MAEVDVMGKCFSIHAIHGRMIADAEINASVIFENNQILFIKKACSRAFYDESEKRFLRLILVKSIPSSIMDN